MTLNVSRLCNKETERNIGRSDVILLIPLDVDRNYYQQLLGLKHILKDRPDKVFSTTVL
jgi:hypothetical protein